MPMGVAGGGCMLRAPQSRLSQTQCVNLFRFQSECELRCGKLMMHVHLLIDVKAMFFFKRAYRNGF